MQRVISILMCLLFVLTALYPAGTVIAACFGYCFELTSVSAFSVATALLFLFAVVSDGIFKKGPGNAAIRILLAGIAPLSLFNAALCIFACPQPLVVVSTVFSAGCSCFLSVKHGKPAALKAAALVLSALMALPIGFLSFIALVFGNIGQNTVVQTVEAPNGRYYAQIIDSDQGALGGDTFVDVHKKGRVNIFLFKMEKKPQRVYTGDWGEFTDMQIYWKNNGCLVINSVEYEIEGQQIE